jgi:hypothetical protein
VIVGKPEDYGVGRRAEDRFVLVLSSGERLECQAMAVERFIGGRAIGVLMTPADASADALRQSELWIDDGMENSEAIPFGTERGR